METINAQNQDNSPEDISIIEILFQYIKYWKWFLISIILCVSAAFLYLRYSVKIYNVYAKVLIKDAKAGTSIQDMNVFSDLGLTLPNSTFDNEIEMLNSEELMSEVKDSLNLGVEYHKKGKIRQVEIYNQTPIFVHVRNQTDWGSFTLDKTDENTWSITSDDHDFQRNFALNEEINSPYGILRFKENPFGREEYPVKIVINHPKYKPLISISPIGKQTTTVYISMQTPTPQKGKEVISTLLHIYNHQTIAAKNQVALQTIEFIDERLEAISGELKSAEKQVEVYKQTQGLTDIESEAHLFMSATGEYGKKISETETQVNVLRSVKNYLLAPENSASIAPVNVGLTDPTILSLIQRYNNEVLAKNAETKGMTANNPVLQEYDDRVALLKDELIKGINISESSLLTVLQELQKQEARYSGKVRSLSTQEREWGELFRQKNIKETLFIYLLQKREETNLSLAMATANTLIIDSPDVNPIPVKPKSKIILFAALLLGFIFPVLIIYIKNLFDNKLHNEAELKKSVTVPFLGEIPLSKVKDKFPVTRKRSRIAEKLRTIITHLGFIVPGKGTKIIMITSTCSGEGKSFFSRNLAMSLASLGKKTLFIDLDMRKSVTNEILNINPGKGIALYLADAQISLNEVIDKSKTFDSNLDIIPIKTFPPNPAELLMSSRLDELFESVKKEDYDYIVVDTPPVGLVSDAFYITKFADVSIYVVRANYTIKNALNQIQTYYKDKKLTNLTLVLNAAEDSPTYNSNRHNYYVED
jgi:capsular exopolysaccharide synthesis family protein